MPTSSRPVMLLNAGPGGVNTAAAVFGKQCSRAVPQPPPAAGSEKKPVLTSKDMGLGTGFMVPLMCRDELVQRGICMNNIYDWQAINSRTDADLGPIIFRPTRSRQECNAHKAVEVINSTFGSDDRVLGEEGYLPVETLSQWVDQYKKPIAIHMDVSRMACATLQPPPLKSLRQDRKVMHLSQSLSKQRFNDTLVRVNSMPGTLLPEEVRTNLRKSQNFERTLFSSRGLEGMRTVVVNGKGSPPAAVAAGQSLSTSTRML
eukprot:TRINITY_DN15632_c0_g2_i1.p1 TRINITY_DN15632_c0_g2~~TRINITY_DN15632_c0_g2_i1.p1  ORF type:complete len:260 (+),score=72.59 TRINITY_DN15632_c0_g2_i1:650-1429(+)